MPVTANTDPDYDSFLTLTIKNYSSQQSKNFLEYRPAVKILFDDYSQTDAKGGRFWQGIASYGTNPTVKFFAGTETFSQEVSQTDQPIQNEWRYMGGTVSISETEMLENSGPVALASLLESRMKQLNRTFNLIIGNEIFSDGTHYDGKTFTGLAAYISTTPTTGVVSGLDSATWTWWRNNATTSCGSFAVNGVNGSTQDLVLRMHNNCTDGMFDRPTDLISDQNTWEYYNRTNLQPVRYIDQVRGTADLSFRALEYQGMKWYWDRQCPTGRLYFLNRQYIHFVIDPRFRFKWTQPMSYPNQLAFTKICGIRLFMRCTSRMFLGVTDGWTA